MMSSLEPLALSTRPKPYLNSSSSSSAFSRFQNLFKFLSSLQFSASISLHSKLHFSLFSNLLTFFFLPWFHNNLPLFKKPSRRPLKRSSLSPLYSLNRVGASVRSQIALDLLIEASAPSPPDQIDLWVSQTSPLLPLPFDLPKPTLHLP